MQTTEIEKLLFDIEEENRSTSTNRETIQTISLTFDVKMGTSDIQKFKKEILKLVGMDNDLYHNHRMEKGKIIGNLERYPLIQYRTHDGFANLWGMNEGAEVLKKLSRDKKFPLKVTRITENQSFAPKMLKTGKEELYKLFRYVPFNHENYEEYRAAPTYLQKIAILERVLNSHLVLFTYAMGWQIPKGEKLKLKLHDITHIGLARYQPATIRETHYFTAIDCSFYLNARFPDQAGIGKFKGLGYGILKRWEEIN